MCFYSQSGFSLQSLNLSKLLKGGQVEEQYLMVMTLRNN